MITDYKIIDSFLSYLISLPLLLTLFCPLFLIFCKLNYASVRCFVIVAHGLSFFSALCCFLILFKFFGLDLTITYSRVFTTSLAWVSLSSPKFPPLEWSIVLDFECVVMVLLITFISFLINVYALSYMRLDPNFKVFMVYFSLFTFFMLVLVTAPNLLQMFLG